MKEISLAELMRLEKSSPNLKVREAATITLKAMYDAKKDDLSQNLKRYTESNSDLDVRNMATTLIKAMHDDAESWHLVLELLKEYAEPSLGCSVKPSVKEIATFILNNKLLVEVEADLLGVGAAVDSCGFDGGV